MTSIASNLVETRNNPWIDLLRSIAILLVLFRHGECALQAQIGVPQGVLQTIFLNGWIGVDLFFVLSGYLIARHLLRAGLGSRDFRISRYLAARALRIVPAYYAVLLLTVGGAFPLFYFALDAIGLRLMYHFLFLQDYLPSDINVVFWSLAVEEKFYLLAPLLILVLLRCRSFGLQAGLLLLLFAFPVVLRTTVFLQLGEGIDYANFWRIFRSPFHMAMEGLVVGVGIALAQHKGLVCQSRNTGILVLVTSLAVLATWMGTHDFMSAIDIVDAGIQPPLLALITGAITLGAVQLSATPMPLARPFQGMARLSYSLYLIHYPLIPLVTAISAARGAVAFWSCYLATSLVAAFVLHAAIERPFLLWKDRIGNRRRQLENAPPSLASRHIVDKETA
jgi:peptidoglycan/LPS O-acetylase OafA/YrhL